MPLPALKRHNAPACAGHPAGAGATAAATAEVDSLWCLYGLGGCSRRAEPLQQTAPHAPEAQDHQAQPGAAHAVSTLALERRHHLVLADEQEASSALSSDGVVGQQSAPRDAEAEPENAPAGGEQPLPTASGLEDWQAAGIAAEDPTAADELEASQPQGSNLAGGAAQQEEQAIEGHLPSRGLASAAETEPSSAASTVGMVQAPSQPATQAPQPATQAPLWPLALGSCIAVAVLVQLLRSMPRRRLPMVDGRRQQALCQQAAMPKISALEGDIDVQAAAAGKLVAPALAAVTCPRPQPAASADLSSLSSPGRPTNPTSPKPGPVPLSVDPSVRVRDATKQGWVAVEAALLASSASGGRRVSEFHNPLYHTESNVAAGEPAVAHSSSSDLSSSAAEWQAKAAAAAAAGVTPEVQKEDGADFRLLAASLPASAIAGLAGSESSLLPGAASSQAAQPASSPFAASRSSGSSDLPSPGSPGKSARQAPRKLTAARSVGPQELPPAQGSEEAIAEGDEETGGQAATPTDPEAVQSSGHAACSRQAETSVNVPAASQGHRGTMPQGQAAAGRSAGPRSSGASSSKQPPGLCVLTAREFQARNQQLQRCT